MGQSHLQAAQPHGEEGTSYLPAQLYSLPNHNSKTVLSIVEIGPPPLARLGSFHLTVSSLPEVVDWTVTRNPSPIAMEAVMADKETGRDCRQVCTICFRSRSR